MAKATFKSSLKYPIMEIEYGLMNSLKAFFSLEKCAKFRIPAVVVVI